MRLLDLKNNLKLWKRVAQTSIGGGNRVTSARLYALSLMIEDETNFNPAWDDDGQVMLDFLYDLSRLVKFAGRDIVSAKEKTIFLHIIMDWCDGKLREVEEWENKTASRLVQHFERFDEPNPPQDSSERLNSSSDLLGEIPF